MSTRATALIADDEPLLRKSLVRMLGEAWPELDVVAQARNGREAIALFDAKLPAVCFLDVHMPGMTGLDAARHIGRRAHLVFVTAFDQYAVEAFRNAAVDYLVKPVEPERLADTVARLQARLQGANVASDPGSVLDALVARLEGRRKGRLRWVHASVGNAVRQIAVEDIAFLRSSDKYTIVAWRSEGDRKAEALVRTPLKDLLEKLDPEQFVQVHRSVVVNRDAISHITRGENETATIHLKGRDEVLPVSRSFAHQFRQM